LFVKELVVSQNILANITNPMLVVLDTAELKKRCYNCYEKEEELVGHHGGDTAPCGGAYKMRVCEGCEVVWYCSEVNPEV
jgi:hypothetical protein